MPAEAHDEAARRRLTIRIPVDLLEWFEKRYHWHGAKQVFVESAFRQLRKLDEANVIVPLDDPSKVISTLKRF